MIEVVIAVGVLGGAVATLLTLLPLLTRQLRDSSDALVAQRLAGGVEMELRRLVETSSLNGVANSIPLTGSEPTLRMVAPRDGREVRIESASTLTESEHYFAIELWRFTSPPLAYDVATNAMLAAHVRVSWPYKIPSEANSAATTSVGDRSSITFTVAISR